MSLFSGPFSSESSATDNRMVATDQAQVLRGSGIITSPYSIALGNNAMYGGYNLRNVVVGKDSTLQIGDSGAAVTAATASFTDALKTMSGQQAQIVQDAMNEQAGHLGSALSELASLASDTQTGGASSAGKTLLWLVLAGLAGLAAIAYFALRR